MHGKRFHVSTFHLLAKKIYYNGKTFLSVTSVHLVLTIRSIGNNVEIKC